ncbi:MAG: VOC family protein [Actinomycetota bacterium]
MSNLNSVVAILPAADHPTAVAWYQRWIGREPDVAPTEGVAEWQLAEAAWIQVTVPDETTTGPSSVVVGVDDLDLQRERCAAAGVEVGDVDDLGFIRLAAATDPAGNTVTFVQVVS